MSMCRMELQKRICLAHHQQQREKKEGGEGSDIMEEDDYDNLYIIISTTTNNNNRTNVSADCSDCPKHIVLYQRRSRANRTLDKIQVRP